MKTRILPLLLIIVCTIAALPVFSQTASKEDLEQKKDALVKEIQSLQKELDQTKTSKKSSLEQASLLQKKIKARQKLINEYNSEIYLINKSINSKVSSVRSLDHDLDTLKMNYAHMVYYAYKHRSAYDRLLFLFSAQDFNDAFRRLKYIRRYNAYRREQAELIRTTTDDLKKEMVDLRTQKKSRQQVLNEQQTQQNELKKEKSQKDQLVKSLSKQEKTLKSDIDKKKKEQEKLKKEIADLIKKEIEEAKKKGGTVSSSSKSSSGSLALTPEAAALSAGFENNMGKLPWPVEKGEISEQFGTHANEIFENVTTKNNGVDIQTSKGASVRAIYKGTVVSILSNPGYHKAVLVRHGEYFTVYSNLASVNVKANQEIDTKQSIGTAFTDPATGESMVHLEVWKGTTLLNPESWIMVR